MDLRLYVENIHRQLAVAAEAGGEEALALAERLVAPLDAAVHLTLQDALSAAAEEITTELAPGSVELRLRGRDLEFVVRPAPVEPVVGDLPNDDLAPGDNDWRENPAPTAATGASAAASVEGDEGAMSRINLRMPDQLKARIEQAAAREGVSVNSWLVRAATGALEQTDRTGRRGRRSPVAGQRYTGWAR
jgi:hypothetical protein